MTGLPNIGYTKYGTQLCVLDQKGANMRHYLYTLQVDRGKPAPIELFIIYAVGDVDAMKKARKRVADHRRVKMTLKRCQGHFTMVIQRYLPVP